MTIRVNSCRFVILFFLEWRKVLTRALFCIVSIFVAGFARADFTFIHTSDTHASSPEHKRVDTDMFKEIAALNPKPAFVVSTGDTVDYGTDAEYAGFRQIAKNLGDIPLYLAPGNHDVRWNPRGKEGYTLGTSGKLYQSWDYHNIHFVTLDSTVLLEHWGHISQEQLDWLGDDLKKVGPDRPVIIGFHHPIGGVYTMVDNQQQLMDRVAPYNVVLWLQGHGHADVDWNVNGTPATMVGALYDGSYDIIRVTGDELRITKRSIPKNQKTELLHSASQPDAPLPEGKLKELMVIPLRKQAAAANRVERDQIARRRGAHRSDAGEGCKRPMQLGQRHICRHAIGRRWMGRAVQRVIRARPS